MLPKRSSVDSNLLDALDARTTRAPGGIELLAAQARYVSTLAAKLSHFLPEFLASTGYSGASHYVTDPVVEDDGVITAPATAPLEFAKHLLEKLRVYSTTALDAWDALFRTGKPEHYFAFVEALKKQSAR